jgi:hypothetical protein
MKILDVPQSGSVAGTTSSRNRFGQYRRTRAIPVNPDSSAQAGVRARQSANAAAWRALTDLQRAGWDSLGLSFVRTDSLGQTYNLTGFMAFCSVNNVNLAAGDPTTADAPAYLTPDALTSVDITLAADTFSIAYTVTPLPTDARLAVFASPQRSSGRRYESDYRLIQVSAAAAASPADIFTAYSARLGTPVEDNRIFVSCVVYLGGFASAPIIQSAIVAA